MKLQEIIQAHIAFRERRSGSKAIVGVNQYSIYPSEDFIPYLGEGCIEPEDIDLEGWLPHYEDFWNKTNLCWGEMLHWASPLNGFPWMEAIAGCPIYVNPTSKSVWAGEIHRYHLGDRISLDPEDPWFQLLLKATQGMVELARGRFPVAPGIMRGISDLLSAILGTTHFFLAIHDEPQAVSEAARALSDLWIAVVKRQYEIILPFYGGYVNAGLWSPGKCPVYQEDAAASISARSYEAIIGAYARQVLQAFDDPIVHLHSVGIHLAGSMLKSEKIPVLEVNLDPSGPPVQTLLPNFQAIQALAPLEIFGSQDDIQTCLDGLSQQGLACLLMKT
ncbi:MAG: hypothetical protein ACM3PY_19880 [Omnitrophica WOR_2 bacterium]